MRAAHLAWLLLLGILWGGSFIFMRVAVPAFGPIALIGLRVSIAASVLVLIFLVWGQSRRMALQFHEMSILGFFNSALPFCLYAYAAQYLTAGFLSILNATTPIWSAFIAGLWLKEKLSWQTIIGLSIGMLGVVVLMGEKAGLKHEDFWLPFLAGVFAPFCYGIAGHYSKQRLKHIAPLEVAMGSQVGAAILLVPLCIWAWPSGPISILAWICVAVMGIASTGLTYIVFFKLIAELGPTKTMTVAFLIPISATVGGFLFLNEVPSTWFWLASALILLGVTLTLFRFPKRILKTA